MTLNDMLSEAQKGALSPRKSSRIRGEVWLTIYNEDLPICEMSDKNLLGSIKGMLSTLPARFILVWESAMGKDYYEDDKMVAYQDWLSLNWFKHLPEEVMIMAEEADDRGLSLNIGESAYDKETEKFIKSIIDSAFIDAKTDSQIKI